ncbi:MAG: FAD-dependent oxidoreductase [Deltaproteobacteria bacterium]|nr:FAD-dependent oxidoreductase [Deltaproteobacteria bacterium]MBW2660835.1 FAD-dependent oxidoreductase [Deltaproteobacteria bacterium]
MKRPKDRLYRVIVIGAAPAGIMAANKLGELGIPVTLVDSDYDLDLKLSCDEYKLKSGLLLNHAHRPGLIRILRNPGIRTILPVEITSIKHSPQGFRVCMNRMETYIDQDQCTLCGRCVEICPVSIPEGGKAVSINSRRSLPGRPVIDKRRTPLCRENCPLGVNVQGYIALAGAGRFKEALALIREDNVLPGICGRICTHPCEKACRRGELDDSIAIRDIKRFLADYELFHLEKGEKKSYIKNEQGLEQKRSEKIAVIGSGPAGLAAAADLIRYGYAVTVFEKEKRAGGLLRYGIGPHRLPRNILDIEIEYIKEMGVNFATSQPVDLNKDIKKLRKDFEAVVLTTGTRLDRKLGVPGEELKGVEGCLSFLKRLYSGRIKKLNKKVAVIGDGNAAFDLARALVRIGADVTIVSWFPMDLIPADNEEIKAAQDEGISIKDCTQVTAFSGQKGKFDRLQCAHAKPGEPDAQGIPWPVIIKRRKPFDLKFDMAFVAVGQAGIFKGKKSVGGLNITDYGFIGVDESLCTNLPGIYAAGDAVSGPSSVVQAMSSGRMAARTIHRSFAGEQKDIRTLRPEYRDYPELPEKVPLLSRRVMPEMLPDDRRKNFSEVALGFSGQDVAFETERCLQCGVCSECLQCVEACGINHAINHAASPEEIIENAGVVIIADPEIVPPIRGEDVIRAYAPKNAKPDIYAGMLRGFASAAQAMTLLGGASQRQKGHGVSFFSPDAGLSSDIRLGVFVCRCNDSLGWLEGMSEYIDNLKSHKDVVHAETITSACISDGSSAILRTVREKGITRVVLASCVCCPLNFVCSACTDQRSRLKDALFTGTGISRSMVEACNLRGEVLRLVKNDPVAAMKKFTGLIDRSIGRAKRLKPLPALVRNYNFTTAVIGESEAAVSSAFTLAEAGMDVFLFGTSKKPLTGIIEHQNIHNFKGSKVRGFSGTLGDFQVFIDMDGFRHTIRVGAIILGERSRKKIQYIHQEGLPSRIVESSLQKEGALGIPFFYPGATSISGLFLADPTGINVSKRKKGAAAAVQAAAIMPRGPRQNKGFTVVVDESLCRWCGRCIQVCPYNAITMRKNGADRWYASVDEALCKGCGNCISVCPSNAVDSPYRNHAYLEQAIRELLEDSIV